MMKTEPCFTFTIQHAHNKNTIYHLRILVISAQNVNQRPIYLSHPFFIIFYFFSMHVHFQHPQLLSVNFCYFHPSWLDKTIWAWFFHGVCATYRILYRKRNTRKKLICNVLGHLTFDLTFAFVVLVYHYSLYLMVRLWTTAAVKCEFPAGDS